MKIGFDTSVYHFGNAGVARFTREIVRALKTQGAEVYECSFSPWFSRKSKWVRWIDTLRYERWWLHHTFPKMMSHHADVIHLSIPDVVKSDIPQVFGLHDLGAYKKPELFSKHMARAARKYIPHAVQNTDGVITVSEFVKQDIIKTFPSINPSSVHVVHNAVGSSFSVASAKSVDQVREHYGLKRPYVLCVSTIAPNKNFSRILEAFSAIIDDTDCDLAVVGGTGWRHSSLQALPAAAKLGERLRILGFIPEPDLPSLYSGATVFCYPSLYEGFGIPVLEAMRCGTAVLTSTVTSLPEVAGDAAVLVDPYSVSAIADGLKKLIQDRALREQLLDLGYRQEKKFSWEKSSAKLITVYKELSSRTHRCE